MPTAILTLGRLPKALAVARALRSQGYRIVVAEPFALHVSRVSRDVARSYTLPAPNLDPDGYRSALLDIIAREQAELLVPISEEAYYALNIRPELPPGVTLFGPEEHLYKKLADKLQFIDLAASKGLPVPASARVTSAEAEAIAKRGDFVTKPINGCSGIAVEYHQSGTQLKREDGNLLVQQRLDGRVVSSLSLVRQGAVQATSTYRGQVYAGTVAICFERETADIAVAVEDWITRFMADIDYTGFVSFDFIVDAHGVPRAIECNPRLTSGVHFFEPQSLGHAITAAAPAPPLPHACDSWQWHYSTLTEAYSALFSGNLGEFGRRMKLCWSVPDVVWSWRDPLPFLLMTPLSWPILKPALFEGISLGEACQRDISPLWAGTPSQKIRRTRNEA